MDQAPKHNRFAFRPVIVPSTPRARGMAGVSKASRRFAVLRPSKVGLWAAVVLVVAVAFASIAFNPPPTSPGPVADAPLSMPMDILIGNVPPDLPTLSADPF